MPRRKNHKYHLPNNKSRNRDTSCCVCVKCGVIRQADDKGDIFYFDPNNETTYLKAPTCAGK